MIFADVLNCRGPRHSDKFSLAATIQPAVLQKYSGSGPNIILLEERGINFMWLHNKDYKSSFFCGRTGQLTGWLVSALRAFASMLTWSSDHIVIPR